MVNVGTEICFREGSFGSEVVWIGTHLVVNSKANKVEVRLPAQEEFGNPRGFGRLHGWPGRHY